MNSYNFFEPHIKPPKKTNYERIIWIAVILISVFAMGYLFYVNMIEEKIVDIQLADINTQISQPTLQQKIKEVSEIEQTKLKIEDSAKKLQFLDLSTAASKSFTYDIFKELNAKVPKNIFLSSVSYDNRSISLRGYSESVENIALFSYQLSKSDVFDNVSVGNVISDNQNYSFDLVATTPIEGLDLPMLADSEAAADTSEEEEQDAESEDE